MDRSEHPGVPQRPPASAMLLVNSTDRYPFASDRIAAPTTSANWTLALKQPVLNGYFTRLALTQLQFYWNLPTIVEGKNDLFLIDISGASGANNISIVLTPGFYSPTALAAEMETEILNEAAGTAAGVGVAWTGSQFHITTTGNYQIRFSAFDETTAQGDPNALANNRFLLTIGGNETMLTYNTSLFSSPPQMTYTRCIDIVSDRLTKYQRVKDATSFPDNVSQAIIARVYPTPPNVTLNESQPGQLFAQPWVMTIDYNTPKHIKWSPDEALHNFDIKLLDEYGDQLYWSPEWATEYQMTFLASET